MEAVYFGDVEDCLQAMEGEAGYVVYILSDDQ